MKNLKLVIASSIAAIACAACSTNPPAAPPRPQPVFGWKAASKQTVALSPSSARSWELNGQARVKIDVDAALPISLGVVNKSLPLDSLGKINFEQLTCSETNVLSSNKECDAEGAKNTVVIRDTRLLGFQSNRVVVTISTWECTSNCS